MCARTRAEIMRAAEASWPWLRGLLNEPTLSWSEVVNDPRHAQLLEIAEQLAEAALEAVPCPGAPS
jgi:hypothetical protein